jgi:hypothetical protein
MEPDVSIDTAAPREGAQQPAPDARADLAFLRALVDDSSRAPARFGAAYLAAGLLYGFQTILMWAEWRGVLDFPSLVSLAIVALPTAALVIYSIVAGWRARRGQPGVANRALNAVFEAAGVANLAVIIVIGAVAASLHNFTVFLIYPCVVFAIQGAAWHVAFRVKRRLWMLAVALGWHGVAVAMGLSLGAGALDLLMAAVTFGLFVLMALPGFVILRAALKEAA